MSFLTEITFRRVASAAPRISATTFAPRVAAASTIHSRHLSSTAPQYKTATEAAKDTLKSVDRAVSDKLVDGINIGSAVAGKVKEASKDITSGKAKADIESKAKSAKSDFESKAKQAKSDFDSKAEEFKRDASSKAEELKRGAQQKTYEAADKTQQAAEDVKKST